MTAATALPTVPDPSDGMLAAGPNLAPGWATATLVGPVPADDPRWTALAAPFPASAISRLPKSTCKECTKAQFKRCDKHTWISGCSECGGNHSSATIHLDYIGHADITARLNEVDPSWTWEPEHRDVDPELLKAAIASGNPEIIAQVIANSPMRYTDQGLWIRLTVLGVTRLGYGDAAGKDFGPAAVKEIIGDALRNAGMRFGIALYLWSKSEDAAALRSGEQHGDFSPPVGAGQQQQPPRQEQRRAPAPAPEPAAALQDPEQGEPVADPAASAVQVAKAAANSSDVEMLRRTYTEASQRGVLRIAVQDHLHDAHLSAAGVPLDRPCLLGAWLQACAAVVTQHRKSVAQLAADLEAPWAAAADDAVAQQQEGPQS